MPSLPSISRAKRVSPRWYQGKKGLFIVRPIITVSSTVTGKLQSMVSNWGTYPTRGLFLAVDCPWTSTSPAYMFTAPSMERRRVVLPEPLGPSSPMKSPSLICRLTSDRTGWASYPQVTPFSSTIGSPGPCS